MTLTWIFAGLSGLVTALLFTAAEWSLWWLLPVWLGFYVALGLLYLIVLFSGFLLLPKKDPSPRTRYVCHRFIKLTLSWILLTVGVRVTLKGADKLPHVPFLLVGNHRSAFDPICTVAALTGQDIVFVAKPGVMNIPVIGAILHRLCFLAIDRENARNAVTTIKRGAELIHDVGLSVGIYPEGTRSKDGNLLPFHAGSFKIAKLAGCPIVVTTVRIKKRRLLPPSPVELRIVDVIDADFVAENNTAALSERTERSIRDDLEM